MDYLRGIECWILHKEDVPKKGDVTRLKPYHLFFDTGKAGREFAEDKYGEPWKDLRKDGFRVSKCLVMF